MKLPLVMLFGLALTGDAIGQSLADSLQQSHIEANVPDDDVIDGYLDRDVLAYLKSEVSPAITSVDVVLLRQGATQSGVAYPKFYIWIIATAKDGSILEGAARTAAIDRQRFEVTNFLSADEITQDPQGTLSIFPAPLVDDILTRAIGR